MICYYFPPPEPRVSNHMCVSSWNCPLDSPLAVWQHGQVDSRLGLAAAPVQGADQLCNPGKWLQGPIPFPSPLSVRCDPSEHLCPLWCSARVAPALGGLWLCQCDTITKPSGSGGWLGLALGHVDVALLALQSNLVSPHRPVPLQMAVPACLESAQGISVRSFCSVSWACESLVARSW